MKFPFQDPKLSRSYNNYKLENMDSNPPKKNEKIQRQSKPKKKE